MSAIAGQWFRIDPVAGECNDLRRKTGDDRAHGTFSTRAFLSTSS